MDSATISGVDANITFGTTELINNPPALRPTTEDSIEGKDYGKSSIKMDTQVNHWHTADANL